MARLFIHDLLFSKDGLQLARKNKTRLRIREFRNVLYYTLELIKKEWGITDNEELREGNIGNVYICFEKKAGNDETDVMFASKFTTLCTS